MIHKKDKIKLGELQLVIRRLRASNGCAWDRKQTFSSLSPHTIEEAYEVDNAITLGDMNNLQEELGDLMLQVVFHSEIAAELELFDLSDILDGVIDKMIRRHPKIFSRERKNDPKISFSSSVGSDSQDVDWDDIKDTEKLNNNKSSGNFSEQQKENLSLDLLLSDIPVALPALIRSVKIQKIIERAGFKNTAQEQLGKIKNILECLSLKEDVANAELRKDLTIESTNGVSSSTEQLSGELLYLCVDYIRLLGIDSEGALRKRNITRQEWPNKH